MPDQSSVTPRSDQLDRIERKLDEVLQFRDQLQILMGAYASGGIGRLLKVAGKVRS